MNRSARYRDAPPGVDEGVPIHLWIVGLLSLAWNAFGAFDFTMTNLRDPGYLADIPPEMAAMIDGMPLWAHAGWALGVWGALIGSVLLLGRSRHAFGAFAVSLLGLAVDTIWQRYAGLPASLETPQMARISFAIWAVAVGLLLYARWMTARCVLR